MERLEIADAAKIGRVAPEDPRAAMQTKRIYIFPKQAPALNAAFDEEHMAATPRCALKTDGAGAGEDVHHPRAVDSFGIGVAQNIE